MSKDDKKEIKVTNDDQEENRLPVGELKWSKEQESKESTELKESKESTELKEENTSEKSGDESSENPVQSEVSATLSLQDKQIEESDLSTENKKQIERENDPLVGIEDTLTPIDFKTYEFDPDELKTIEQELNTFQSQTLDKELDSFNQQTLDHDDDDYQDYEDYEEGEPSSENKWLKWSIWIIGVPALLVIVLFISLIIGHTVIGGQPVSDIFDINMWQHLYNLIYG